MKDIYDIVGMQMQNQRQQALFRAEQQIIAKEKSLVKNKYEYSSSSPCYIIYNEIEREFNAHLSIGRQFAAQFPNFMGGKEPSVQKILIEQSSKMRDLTESHKGAIDVYKMKILATPNLQAAGVIEREMKAYHETYMSNWKIEISKIEQLATQRANEILQLQQQAAVQNAMPQQDQAIALEAYRNDNEHEQLGRLAANLQEQLLQQGEGIRRINITVEEQRTALQQKDSLLQQKDSLLQQKDSTIQQKDHQIELLSATNDETSARLNMVIAENQELKADKAELRADKVALQRQIEALREIDFTKSAQIQELNIKVHQDEVRYNELKDLYDRKVVIGETVLDDVA